MVRILKPAAGDWIGHAGFAVVVDGLDGPGCRVVLARSDGENAVRADLTPAPGGVGWAWIDGAGAVGRGRAAGPRSGRPRGGVHADPSRDLPAERPRFEDGGSTGWPTVPPAWFRFGRGCGGAATSCRANSRIPGIPAELDDLLADHAPSGGPVHVATLLESEENDLSGFLGAPDAPEAAPGPRYRTDPTYLAHLEDAYVLMDRGLVICDGALWGPSSRPALHGLDPRLVPGFVPVGEGLAWTRIAGARRYRGRLPVLLTNAAPGNIGHWVLNSLWSAYLLRPLARQGRIAFVAPRLTAFMRESLDVLGVLDSLVEIDDLHLQAERPALSRRPSRRTRMRGRRAIACPSSRRCAGPWRSGSDPTRCGCPMAAASST